jgi:hypothetical protein
LPVVLNGCGTLYLTLRGKYRLRVLKTFGLKVDEVTGDWRRLHSEELYDLYF